MSNEYPLNVPAPHHFTFAVRDIPDVTVEQRERVLKATHYNEFAFPAGMLTVDMLSDSGTTAMTNHQWASLFLGDEAYGRNTGYYVLSRHLPRHLRARRREELEEDPRSMSAPTAATSRP